jgi:hypothetical protein
MGNQAPIAEQFFAELDQLGAAQVRDQLVAGAWGKSGRRVKLAKLWLEDQDRAQATAAHAEIARGSHDAARRSADAADAAYDMARDANFRAALAIAIAAASLIVQLALAYLRLS